MSAYMMCTVSTESDVGRPQVENRS